MKICLVGLDNLPILAPEYRQNTIGGESVQQTLLARALARRGHAVSMVVADYGQADGGTWGGIRAFKAFGFEAGIPGLRFFHPRWTGMWAALARADADLYYTSCAGMQVGLVALFCRRHGKRFVFRAASDADCDKTRLLIRYARDRWLYAYGLKRADGILVQSASQAKDLARSYGLSGQVAGMLVEKPPPAVARDIDVLWVSNIREVKRPDRILAFARQYPEVSIHMVGGPLPGEETLFRNVAAQAAGLANVTFHGPLPYRDANLLYDRARLLVNTSDVEGFPNSYLQSWIRGVPVVTLLDPDRVIELEGLGFVLESPAHIASAALRLLADPALWQALSNRCRTFMAREYGEDRIFHAYLDMFQQVVSPQRSGAATILPAEPRHV